MLFDRLRSQTNPRFDCMTQFFILFGINRMYFTSTLGLWPFLKSGLTDLLIYLSSCRALVPVWYAPTSRTTWWVERTGRSVIIQDRSDLTTLLFHTQHYITKYSYPVTIESISFRNYMFFVSDYIFFKTKIDSLHFAICLWQFFFQFWLQALLPDDIAKSVEFVLATPPHVQVNLNTMYRYFNFQYLSYAYHKFSKKYTWRIIFHLNWWKT